MSPGLRVGVVGCGLIGAKRAAAIGGDDELAGCFDVDAAAAETFAGRFGCQSTASLEGLLALGLDAVIVAVPHNRLAPTTLAALEAGSHVLVEKPAAIGSAEVDVVAARARALGRRVKVGFNHRFSPAIEQAVETARSGRFGDLLFARARYGHGGRPGYEREWRMRPELSGGGELIDQGMHLIDIFHWLFGPLPLHAGLLRTQFWDAEVEDNAVLILGDGADRSGPWAMAHVSWTEWKNTFSLEVYCRTGKLQVDGLWRSYGPATLTVHAMRPELGPPDTEVFEFPDEDVSWEREWAHFRDVLAADEPLELSGDLSDARYAWARVEDAYRA